MALIGQGAYEPTIKLLDDSTQEWPDTPSPATFLLYCGQGFEKPEDYTWVNKPTGAPGTGSHLMGFPRSAEFQPNQSGVQKWYISEA